LWRSTLLNGLKSPSDLATFNASKRSRAVSKSRLRNWFGRSPFQILRAEEFRHDRIIASTYYVKRRMPVRRANWKRAFAAGEWPSGLLANDVVSTPIGVTGYAAAPTFSNTRLP
jgi:hypothetical protein